MIKVDSKRTVRILAKKDYRFQKRRNTMAVFAILIVTFLMTTILSVGINYQKILSHRSVMMKGMKFDLRLTEPDNFQVETARQMGSVLYAGVSVSCAEIEKYGDKVAEECSLVWLDEICWEKQCLPALESVRGTYPQEENELMLSETTLYSFGVEQPQIGMELPVTYQTGEEEPREKVFVLSGYYRDYTGESRGYVSQKFYETTGVKQTDNNRGYLNLTLKNPLYSPQTIANLRRALETDFHQAMIGDPDAVLSFLKVMAGIGIFLLMLFGSAYLFIFYIFYISILKEIQFFGQLKTIGMTGKQIKKMIRMQAVWDAAGSIPIGAALGILVSNAAVPAILTMASPTLDVDKSMRLYPSIIIGTVLFVGITVWSSIHKPIKIAAEISPIEAAKYEGKQPSIRKTESQNGGKLFNMARRNLVRNKKQTALIIFSFWLALTIFLAADGVIRGNSAERIYNQTYQEDLTVRNQSGLTQKKQEVTEQSALEIEAMEGIQSVRKIFSSSIVMPYEEETLGTYYRQLYESRFAPSGRYEEDLAEYESDPWDTQLAKARIVGINEAEFEILEQELGDSVDREAFLDGEGAIIQGFIPSADSVGKEIGFYEEEGDSNLHQIKILADASELKERPNFLAMGYAPALIVSESCYKKIISEPFLEQIKIEYETSFDQSVEEEIRAMFDGAVQIVFESKLEDYQRMSQTESEMRLLGWGMGILLTMLVVINYCNMTAARVQDRRREFALLKSVGMTSRQIKKCLAAEGICYGGAALCLTGVFGIPISYLVFQSMNQYRIEFSLSIKADLVMTGSLLMICTIVPLFLYRTIQQESVVEQLKEF